MCVSNGKTSGPALGGIVLPALFFVSFFWAKKRKKKRECFRYMKNTIENNCGMLLNTDTV
jgi:hypothetical protein